MMRVDGDYGAVAPAMGRGVGDHPRLALARDDAPA